MSPTRGKPAPRPRGRRTSEASGRGALRVVAGSRRGLRLDSPPGSTTRPTSDRVRQATFNALESLDAVAEAVVLDAFAGSGALGIEALSRGAAQVTFADTDPRARATIEANLAATDFATQGRIIATDGARSVSAGGPWNLVLLDPPYEHEAWPALLDAVAAHLAEDGVVVIESDREISLPAGLDAIRVKGYGGTVVTIASPRRSTS